MSKEKLSDSDWMLVKDAPYWVNAALAAAEGKVAVLTSRREAKALQEAISSYQGDNALVRDIVAQQGEPAKEVKNATQSTAEENLAQIATIVEEKLGEEDLDALNDFLLYIGQTVAGAAGEGMLGLGEKVSEKEQAALEDIAEALRATDEHGKERRLARQRQQKEEWQAEKEAEAQARAQSTEKAEAEARAKAQAQAREKEAEKAKAAAASEVRKKAEQVRREAQKARQATQEKQKAEREVAAREAEEAKAAEEAAAAEAAKFIAEHEVVPGDNLSMISQKYYGTQVNWPQIYEANKEIIGDNPSLIRPGQRLRIPKL